MNSHDDVSDEEKSYNNNSDGKASANAEDAECRLPVLVLFSGAGLSVTIVCHGRFILLISVSCCVRGVLWSSVELLPLCLLRRLLCADSHSDELAAFGAEVCPFSQKCTAVLAVTHDIVDMAHLCLWLYFGVSRLLWKRRNRWLGCRACCFRHFGRVVKCRPGLIVFDEVRLVIEGYFEFLVSHLNLNGFEALGTDEMTLEVLDFFDGDVNMFPALGAE